MELNAHNKQEYRPAHTAEHILNQTMVRFFGCPRSNNAHVERKKSKCDYLLNSAPSQEQITSIEEKVNEIINSHCDVTIEFMQKEQAAQYVDLSKLPENASETLRIVKIGDYDVCACIGAHVDNTSEIGKFTIISDEFTPAQNPQEAGRWRLRWKIIETK